MKLIGKAIYVFSTGEYSRRSIEMVSTDVKVIAKMYVEKTNMKNFSSSCDAPDVEIWKNDKVINYFHDHEKDENKLIKLLSKLAMEIE